MVTTHGLDRCLDCKMSQIAPTNSALLDELNKQYPDTIDAIKSLSHDERIAYIAKRELIAHIQLILEKE